MSLEDHETKELFTNEKVIIKNKKKIGTGDWLEIEEIEYIEPITKTIRTWEVCKRKTNFVKQEVDDIHGIIHSPNLPPQIILVIQYRPPIERYCIEFPSGLIDQGETVGEAALRELQEETGYIGKIKNISDPICYEPGLTDSMTRIVDIEIDLSLKDNISPLQSLDVDEWSLKVIKLPLYNLYDELKAYGLTVDYIRMLMD
ncbi:10380_t:CDS:2 [Diversispora eburnea]|uniref:10380_t:CDS:1 n=1 Tax=Diversispora eburnea TaxID=1213867 RepID=A0A9N9BWZ6_9GLOM|nr:10380_t:CDS:2 [Diversispora eburnea]